MNKWGTPEEWLGRLRTLERDFDAGEPMDDSEELLEEVPALVSEIIRLNKVLDKGE